MEGVLHCEHCGEVIGVYEPMVAVEGARERVSSLALEPLPHTPGMRCFHRECFPAAAGSHRRARDEAT